MFYHYMQFCPQMLIGSVAWEALLVGFGRVHSICEECVSTVPSLIRRQKRLKQAKPDPPELARVIACMNVANRYYPSVNE